MRRTALPNASEHLERLMDIYEMFPGLKALPCAPVPSGYVRHQAILGMLYSESRRPFVAVRGFDGWHPSRRGGLTSEESMHLVQKNNTDCWTSTCACYAVANNAPLIHITQELAQAFADTDPSTEPSDYRIPFPAFILSLPTDLVKNSYGDHFSFILVSSIAEVRDWWYSSGYCNGRWGLSMGEGKDFYICGYSLATGCQYMPMKWQDIGKVCQGAFDNARDLAWIPPELSDGCDFSTLCRIVCNAILAINHAPELFYEEAAKTRGLGFGNGASRGSIRWLGKTYQQNRVTTNAEPTGRTYRPHWRRGHWHTVLHGAQRALRKLQWFQPVYVNGRGEE
jgi:hypothetical protein